MFDLFSKFNDIKEKAKNTKDQLESKRIEYSSNGIKITANGKKDILNIKLDDTFLTMPKDEQEMTLQTSINNILNQSESFAIEEFKKIIPNIPGMNIFG